VKDTDNDPLAKDFFSPLDASLRVRPGADGGPVLFSQLNLSRPLLRAVEAMGYVTPTPIQVRKVVGVVVVVVVVGEEGVVERKGKMAHSNNPLYSSKW